MTGLMIARTPSRALDPQRGNQIAAAHQLSEEFDRGIHRTRAHPRGSQRCPHVTGAQSSIVSRRVAGRRQWVEHAGATSATTPMWTRRSAWLDALRLWADPAAVQEVCARLGCSINAATMLAIATAMADYADHDTGRNMAATRATLAQRVGCSPRTITTAWRVLRAADWIVLAAPGHGNARTPSARCRPSIWHLTPRRTVDHFHLPPRTNYLPSSLVEKHSPSAPARAGKISQRKKPRPATTRTQPRPIALQRLAAQLVASTHGIDRRSQHIGAVCDAFTSSGIDSQAWTARQLKNALEADMRATGWNWPDHITNPIGFLISRLRRLPAQPGKQQPKEVATQAQPASQRAQTLNDAPQDGPTPRVMTSQQCARIALAQQHCRQVLERAHHRTQSALPDDAGQVSARTGKPRHPSTPAPSNSCSVCGSPQARQRPYLPLHRSCVCDKCWGSASCGIEGQASSRAPSGLSVLEALRRVQT